MVCLTSTASTALFTGSFFYYATLLLAVSRWLNTGRVDIWQLHVHVQIPVRQNHFI